MYSVSLTNLLLSCLGPLKGPVLSVSQPVSPSKCPKKKITILNVDLSSIQWSGNRELRGGAATPTLPNFQCWNPTLPYLLMFSNGLYSLLTFLFPFAEWSALLRLPAHTTLGERKHEKIYGRWYSCTLYSTSVSPITPQKFLHAYSVHTVVQLFLKWNMQLELCD